MAERKRAYETDDENDDDAPPLKRPRTNEGVDKLTPDQRRVVMDLIRAHERRDEHGLRALWCVAQTGAGKSWIAAAFATLAQLRRIVVIGPRAAYEQTLRRVLVDEFGLPTPLYHLTWEALTARGNALVHNDAITADGLAALTGAPTLLILDEAHAAKNMGTQRERALTTLVHTLATRGHSKSTVLWMSASPFDRQESVLTFLRINGIVDPKLPLVPVRRRTSTEEPYGFLGAHAFFVRIAPVARLTLPRLPSSAARARELMYEFFTRLVMPRIAFGHLRQVDPELQHTRVRRFMRITDAADRDLLARGHALMADAVARRAGTVITTESSKLAIGDFARGMRLVEEAKLRVIVAAAQKVLASQCTAKVVIGINFPGTHLRRLLDAFASFAPLAIHANDTDRTAVVDAFNAPSTVHRVIVIGLRSGGVGISLHDTDGRFPRHVFFTPTYHYIECEQFTGRFDRHGVRSAVALTCVFAAEARDEQRLLRAMARKGRVLEAVADKRCGTTHAAAGHVDTWPEVVDPKE